ncbi:MAG: hypothetical protein ETSY1_05445 [Candidatus Entotheonella factor]|uniref:Alginate O-acetyltransferase n=1 Tax=Entotheonella factor TaxID=1429438 RepID=W4LVK1_ENTF1|nr:MAG: hypothetical protein ETSY1_05445 [Candidatus Entotheonella factor]
MSLAGLGFALFLPCVLLVYWLLPRRAGWQNAWLLLASYAFYASWSTQLLPLLWLSTLVDYGLGYGLMRTEAKSSRQGLLMVSLVVNIGILATFKYAGFFANALNDLFMLMGFSSALPVLQLALPLGISYLTLLKIGYVIDVYYGRIEAERSLLNFALFVCFFPHLIAGPIVRAQEMLPQYAQARTLSPAHIQNGAWLLFLGFFMKAYVAEILGHFYANPVFNHPELYSALGHWIGLLGYAGQLFCDFADYSLIAMGVGWLVGLRLPENFNYPFLSTSMMAFWRRWHMTLNNWLFDYLYGPMTMSRGWMRGRLGLGFLIVFVISGLWHGPLWTFVLWGFLHGMALVTEYRWDLFYKGLCRKDRTYVARRQSRSYQMTAWFITQLFFLLTLIPFRATSLSHAWQYAKGLFGATGGQIPNLFSFNLAVCVSFFVLYHVLELAPGQPWRAKFLALSPPVRGVVYGLVIVFLLLFMPVGRGTFIYANF